MPAESAPKTETKRPCSGLKSGARFLTKLTFLYCKLYNLGLRFELKRCLLKTDCCLVEKKTPYTCLQEGNVDQDCKALAYAFYECKRSLLDMRTRFRGRKGYWTLFSSILVCLFCPWEICFAKGSFLLKFQFKKIKMSRVTKAFSIARALRSDSEYAKQMKFLSASIFGEVRRPTDPVRNCFLEQKHRMKKVLIVLFSPT